MVIAGHFLLHDNRSHSMLRDNVSTLYAPYNIHSEITQPGKAKTMSVHADARSWYAGHTMTCRLFGF